MRRAATLLVVAAVALAACGKTATYSRSSKFRHGDLPSGWEKTKVKGMAVAFYHSEYGATAGVAPVCQGVSDSTLESLAQQELVGLEQRELVEESRVSVDGREAIDWVVRGSVDGVLVLVNLVVFRKQGCVYDLNLVSRPETFERARTEFRGFVAGFSLLED